MADIRAQILPGVVIDDGAGGLYVNVSGGRPAVQWPASGYSPIAGDHVKVALYDGVATVLGPVVDVPRPFGGTVATSPVNGRVGVLGDDGITYQCRYIEPAPATSTRVFILWQTTDPVVLSGALAALDTDPVAAVSVVVPPSPPAVQTGTTYANATASGSWRSTGWENGQVRQGAYSGNPYRGAWFYGGQLTGLAGRTITRIQIRIPARQRIGSFNAEQTANFRVASGTGPNNWGTASSVYGISIPANFGGGWADLPLEWAGPLIVGSGIGIQDNPYMGFNGLDADGASGQLAINWRI